MSKNDQFNIHLATFDKLKFKKLYNVSRETMNQLDIYEEYLLRSNEQFNLIGSGTLKYIWSRHFADSAKLFFLIKSKLEESHEKISICDIGSGAGFPGVIIKIFSNEFKLNCDIELFESNKKKSNFLGDLTKKLKLNMVVNNSRVEDADKNYDIILCRAVSNLLNIINMSRNCSKNSSLLVLPKGKNWSKELIEAKKVWNFKLKLVKNNKMLDTSGGVTLLINEVKKNK